MKANHSFSTADTAVSPVIGVILMVAITVVLAATVFVLVSDLGDTGDAPPALAFYKDETRDRLEVASADKGADWDRLAVKVVQCKQSEIGVGGVTTGARIVMGTVSANHVNVAATAASTSYLNTAASTGGDVTCGAAILVEVTDAAAPMIAGDFIEFCNESNTAAGAEASFVDVQVIDTSSNSKVWEGRFPVIRKC